MHLLGPNGGVKTQGIALEGYTVDEVGSLSAPALRDLLRKMRWTRDMIVFHCYSYEDVLKLPAMDPATKKDAPIMQEAEAQEPLAQQQTEVPPPCAAPSSTPVLTQAATEPPPSQTDTAIPSKDESSGNGALRRGQHLKIKFGDKLWEAIYWGHDNKGHVVAHRTCDQWSLMHLDIERFGHDMTAVEEVNMGLLKQIEQNLVTQVEESQAT